MLWLRPQHNYDHASLHNTVFFLDTYLSVFGEHIKHELQFEKKLREDKKERQKVTIEKEKQRLQAIQSKMIPHFQQQQRKLEQSPQQTGEQYCMLVWHSYWEKHSYCNSILLCMSQGKCVTNTCHHDTNTCLTKYGFTA